jgi:hypothetical protein
MAAWIVWRRSQRIDCDFNHKQIGGIRNFILQSEKSSATKVIVP